MCTVPMIDKLHIVSDTSRNVKYEHLVKTKGESATKQLFCTVTDELM